MPPSFFRRSPVEVAKKPSAAKTELSQQLDDIANLASSLNSEPSNNEEADSGNNNALVANNTLTLNKSPIVEDEANDLPVVEGSSSDKTIQEENIVVESMTPVNDLPIISDQTFINSVENMGDIGIPYSSLHPRVESPLGSPVAELPGTKVTYYSMIRKAIKCAFHPDSEDEDGDNERLPLLPIHNRPDETDSPESPNYGKIILEFIWHYILTEPIREFLKRNEVIVFILMSIFIILLFVIAYFTGTLHFVIRYIKTIICWIANLSYNDNTPFQFICQS